MALTTIEDQRPDRGSEASPTPTSVKGLGCLTLCFFALAGVTAARGGSSFLLPPLRQFDFERAIRFGTVRVPAPKRSRRVSSVKPSLDGQLVKSEPFRRVERPGAVVVRHQRCDQNMGLEGDGLDFDVAGAVAPP